MAIAVGYNAGKAKEVMDNVVSDYSKLGEIMSNGWDTVTTTLQNEWIGPDEQKSEDAIAKRLCTLYSNASELANSCIQTIAGLTNSWMKFQESNGFEGDMGASLSRVEAPTLSLNDTIVKKKERTFSESDDMGLQTESSATTIKTSIEEYVTDIKTQVQTLFDDINVGEAFFGEQTTVIKTYVEKVGTAIAEVAVAVKDMYNEIDTIAGTQYTQTAMQDINTQFTEANSNVDSSVDSLGESRWG